jgi:hypothetical protein
MNDNNFEQLLEEKLNDLPMDIQPSRDLWSGIDLALENQADVANKNKVLRWAAFAASFAIVGLLGVMSLNLDRSSGIDPYNMRQMINSVNNQHENQKQFLLTSYEQLPALTDNWQDQLKELDNAATVIKAALEEDPSDANLIKLLQQVYQQQIKLIQSVHQSRWL